MHICDYYIKLYDEYDEINKKIEQAYCNPNVQNELTKGNENKDEIGGEEILEPKPAWKNENSKWIKKIYLKMLFIYHPDKNIKPNETIFTNIKNTYDNDDFSLLFYYFIRERSNPYIETIFKEISNATYFIASLESLSNHIIDKINSMRNSVIYLEYVEK